MIKRGSRAYRLWNLGTKQIHVGVDVIIHETLGISIGDTRSKYTEPSLETIVVIIPTTHAMPVAPIHIAHPPTSSERLSVSMPLLSEGSNHIHTNHILQDSTQEQGTQSEVNSIPADFPVDTLAEIPAEHL